MSKELDDGCRYEVDLAVNLQGYMVRIFEPERFETYEEAENWLRERLLEWKRNGSGTVTLLTPERDKFQMTEMSYLAPSKKLIIEHKLKYFPQYS